jgi:hypothetical protein
MGTYTAKPFSGSANGRGIKVTATSTPGTTIHTAVNSTDSGVMDENWLYACNLHTSVVNLTIEFGGTTAPDDTIVVPLQSKSGLVPIIPGLRLNGNVVIKAFASVANVVMIVGNVNAISA